MAGSITEGQIHLVRVFLGDLVPAVQSTAIYTSEFATSREVVDLFLRKLSIQGLPEHFELVEVCYRDSIADQQSEKILSVSDRPVKIQQDWGNLKPKARLCYRLFLREKHCAGEPERALLRHSWMDCHESVNSVQCNLDLDSKLPDDDLCSLPKLTEDTLLDHLQERFKRGRIYTYVGEILISVNPFRFFPIYNPKYINAYTNRNLGSLPPHIFAIADVAYHRMLKEKKSQCVVISGESGSGKTESTKLLVHHLTTLGRKAQATSVEKTILGAGPVLEAFGNAKTAYNNNSSRFGKFTQIKFREDGVVCGAALRKYLLEKSRLVCQAPEERNYHVFYYLLAGASAEDKEALHLTKPQDYTYLNQSECFLEGIDEAYEFFRLKKSMDMVGFTPEIQRKIWIMLSAVLHIGNIEFIRKPGFEDSAANVKGGPELEIVSNLLMVGKDDLIDVLTTRKHKTKREQIIVPYKYEEALATRNAIAKALYSTLFDWIVLQVNHALVIKQANSREGYSIGVLDIFGFEDFQHNSFEQFCINFANEKLQYYFNQHVFKLEQDEYVAEGIQWRSVEFVDNFACLDLISGRPTGLLNLIDEESSFPGASESSLLDKIIKNHSGNNYFEQTLISPAFVIKHYAGNVKYTIGEFLNKNRDLMRPEILKALKHSDMRFVREILGADPLAVYRWAILRAFFKGVHAFRVAGKRYRESGRAAERANRRRSRHIKITRLNLLNADEEDDDTLPYNETTSVFRKASKVLRRMKNNKPATKPLSKIRRGLEAKRDMSVKSFDYLQRTLQRNKGAPKNPPTVSAQFQSSLNRLMEILGEAQPFFVRCMRSNAEKAPLVFDRELVLRQLRYTGMLETVRIRQLGYQWRFSLPVFMERFSILFPNELDNPKDELPDIMKTYGLDAEEYQIGKSKIFLRESQHRILQSRRRLEIDYKVKVIQRWARGLLQRRQFLQQRTAAITIQAFYRGAQVREELAKQGWAATRIQASWRQYTARKLYLRLVRGTIFLQSYMRGRLARIRYLTLVKEHQQKLAEIEQKKMAAEAEEEEERKQVELAIKAALVRIRSFSDSVIHVDQEEVNGVNKDARTEGEEEKEKETEKPAEISTDVKTSDETEQDDRQNVRSISKMFEKQMNLCVAEVSRRRSSSEPSSPKSPRPSPLNLAVDAKSSQEKFRRRSQALSPDKTPNRNSFNRKNELESNETKEEAQNTVVALPRKVSSSIRRRLSGRSKGSANRRSTSDVPDPRAVTLARSEKIPASKDYRRHGQNKKKGFFQKMGRANSREFEVGQAKPAPTHKRSSASPASTDDLSKAMRETKIVTAISSPVGGIHGKQAGQKIIQGTEDLGQLRTFLMNKISILNKEENKRDTIVDRVFRKALQEFHGYIVSTDSALTKNDTSLSMKYEDLTSTFENILKKVVKGERISASFPTIMGVNAFSGVITEFVMTRSVAANKHHKPNKRHHHKKRKQSEHIKHNGHKLILEHFSISTFCEHCNNKIWVLEKGLVCQDCRFVCHKKCYVKSSAPCRKGADRSSRSKGLIFGADLTDLVTDEQPMPTFVELLIQDIEKRGMFVEGIYRKSPSGAMVKSLKASICSVGIDKVRLEDYPVLVVAAVLKLFFRQLSPSLITEELYMEFLRSTELSDPRELLNSLRVHTQKLPRANQDVLERLVFHFARVASHSDVNLMNPNAIAIIWSACILRPPPSVGPLESLQHVGRQTRCLEALISGQVTKLRTTLNDIWVLDKATDTATKRLSQLNRDEDEDLAETVLREYEEEEEKRLLAAQLGTLQEQKARLAASLSTMEPRTNKEQESGEDLTSDDCVTDEELDAAEDPHEEYALTFDLPAAPVQLRHLTKHRAAIPVRRTPTRSKMRVNAIKRTDMFDM